MNNISAKSATFLAILLTSFGTATTGKPVDAEPRVGEAGSGLHARLEGYYAIRAIATRHDRIVLEACRGPRLYLLIVGSDGAPSVADHVGDCPDTSRRASEPVTGRSGSLDLTYPTELPARPGVAVLPADRQPPNALPPLPALPPLQIFQTADDPKSGRVIASPAPPVPAYTQPEAPQDPAHGRGKSIGYSPEELHLFVRRQGYRHVVVLVADPPTFLVEGCRKDRRWRLAIDRKGHISDREEVGPCFRKFLGVGMDDVQGALHWLVGCEAPIDDAALPSLRLGPAARRIGQFAAPRLDVPQVPRSEPAPKPQSANVTVPQALPVALPAALSFQPQGLPAVTAETWTHNGSRMQVSRHNSEITIAYDEPRHGIARLGIRSGAVLFEGQVSGSEVHGRLTYISARCNGLTYPASGSFSRDERLSLTGRRPIVGAHCSVLGSEIEHVTFDRPTAQLATVAP
jgi:hypothetical protein